MSSTRSGERDLSRPPGFRHLARQRGNEWLIVKLTLGRLLVAANALSVMAAFVFLAVAMTEHLNVAVIVGSMFVYSVGVGSAAPAALSKAISVDRHVIGSDYTESCKWPSEARLPLWSGWVITPRWRQQVY
jgi:hypothetical protein